MKIYICGPMSGYPNCNFDSFDEAYVRLIEKGHIPISPTDLDRLYEGWETYPPENFVPDKEFCTRVMDRDLAAIKDCDAIYLLNGWKGSAGVRVELALAEYLGLDIMYEEDESKTPLPPEAYGKLNKMFESKEFVDVVNGAIKSVEDE